MAWRDELRRELRADPAVEVWALAFIWIPATAGVALLLIGNILLLLHREAALCP